jgi:hypothetical protein
MVARRLSFVSRQEVLYEPASDIRPVQSSPENPDHNMILTTLPANLLGFIRPKSPGSVLMRIRPFSVGWIEKISR